MLEPTFVTRSALFCAIVASTLTACSSGGNANIPAPGGIASAPAAQDDDATMPALPYTFNDNGNAADGRLTAVATYPGAVNGRAGAFDPAAGDFPQGGLGQVVARLPCSKLMVRNRYHIHFFLGIIDHGKEIALPSTIGIVDPRHAKDGFTNGGRCAYYLHTHDSSGIVHVEVPEALPYGSELYDLRRFLDVWGVSHGEENFGGLHGKVRVFVGNAALKQTTVSLYREASRKLGQIPIASHEAIWIVIGDEDAAAAKLPPVTFYMEY
jgi:hypothetical protein